MIKTENLEDYKGTPISAYDDRNLILSKLNDAINQLHEKAINGRIKNPENEKVRIQYFKVLAYTCNVYSQIKKDTDLEELLKKIELMTDEIIKLKEGRNDES
jgi:hypothetical protein